jgi:protein TonB
VTFTITPETPNDRFMVAVFAAILFHVSVILGLEFEFSIPKELKQLPQKLEVTLVHGKTEEKPEEADYLAQMSQKGGGNIEEKVRPSSPLANPKPVVKEQGKSPRDQELQIPQQQQRTQQRQVLTAQQNTKKSNIKLHQDPEEALDPTPSATQLMMRSREIARLSAEIKDRQQLYASMPRQKYITANTKEYIYASYEESWRLKVERIGNINYPEGAIRKRLSGTLVVDVAIKHDGSLHDVRIIKSSGSKILDDGAIYIVKLAAPFSPFTPDIRKETDILHITRAWQFRNDHRLTTR